LANRTGQTLSAPIAEVDTVTIEATERLAKQHLKEMMVGAPQGDIKAWGTPFIEPFDHIRSVPICDGSLNTDIDIPPLDYEVQRVVHTKESESEYKTRLEVGIHVDVDQIEVVEAKLEGGSDSEDEDESDRLPLVGGFPLLR
jgi:hypothetical protein